MNCKLCTRSFIWLTGPRSIKTEDPEVLLTLWSGAQALLWKSANVKEARVDTSIVYIYILPIEGADRGRRVLANKRYSGSQVQTFTLSRSGKYPSGPHSDASSPAASLYRRGARPWGYQFRLRNSQTMNPCEYGSAVMALDVERSCAKSRLVKFLEEKSLLSAFSRLHSVAGNDNRTRSRFSGLIELKTSSAPEPSYVVLISPPLRNLWPVQQISFLVASSIYGAAVDVTTYIWLCSVRPYQAARVDYLGVRSLFAVFDRFAECVLNGGIIALDKYTLHKSHLVLQICCKRPRDDSFHGWSLHPLVDLIIRQEEQNPRERRGTIYRD